MLPQAWQVGRDAMKPDNPATPKQRVVPPSFGRRPMSLSINQALMDAYVENNPLAVAVISSWKFKARVIQMPSDEFDEKVSRGWGA